MRFVIALFALLMLFSYGCLENPNTNQKLNNTTVEANNTTNTSPDYSSYSVEEAIDSGKSLVCEGEVNGASVKAYFDNGNFYQIIQQNGNTIKLAIVDGYLYLSGIPEFGSCKWVKFSKTGQNVYGPVTIDLSNSLASFNCHEGSADLSSFSFDDVCVYGIEELNNTIQ